MATPMKALLHCLFLFVAGASTAWAQGNGSSPGLLSSQAGPSSPTHPGRGVLRSARVAPDKEVLQQLRVQLQNKPSEPRTLVLRFFDEATFVVVIDRIESPGLGAISYHGRVQGTNDGHVVIVELNGNVGINVEANGRSYEVRYFGDEGYFARELNRSGMPMHPPNGAPIASVIRLHPKAAKPGEAIALMDTGSQIDVMVLYTQAASALGGGTAAMDTLAANMVAEINTIYASSSTASFPLTQRLHLVYSGPVTHTETNMDADLDSITGKTDGVLDDVHILRDAYGADFVTLIGVYGEACGLGWVMETESTGSRTSSGTTWD